MKRHQRGHGDYALIAWIVIAVMLAGPALLLGGLGAGWWALASGAKLSAWWWAVIVLAVAIGAALVYLSLAWGGHGIRW